MITYPDYRLSLNHPPKRIHIYDQAFIDKAGWLANSIEKKPADMTGDHPEYIDISPFLPAGAWERNFRDAPPDPTDRERGYFEGVYLDEMGLPGSQEITDAGLWGPSSFNSQSAVATAARDYINQTWPLWIKGYRAEDVALELLDTAVERSAFMAAHNEYEKLGFKMGYYTFKIREALTVGAKDIYDDAIGRFLYTHYTNIIVPGTGIFAFFGSPDETAKSKLFVPDQFPTGRLYGWVWQTFSTLVTNPLHVISYWQQRRFKGGLPTGPPTSIQPPSLGIG